MNHVSGDKAKDRSQGELTGILKELGYTEDMFNIELNKIVATLPSQPKVDAAANQPLENYYAIPRDGQITRPAFLGAPESARLYNMDRFMASSGVKGFRLWQGCVVELTL
ncbi:NADH-cytochrome b5 reductase 2 [Striga asiatica]|uniref:NADH-cytochrome b5 reductase 2 n=1 Tax=Striga asiatica TaxID=4170 RepID=A0A5A7QPW4_STRAF|nr:NADH-cytochrome b5 reductase 2 [Striga asiatica]